MYHLHRAELPQGFELRGIRIESVLAKGGFGITYLGTRLSNNQQLVIKENIPLSCAYRHPNSIMVCPIADTPESGIGSFAWSKINFIEEAQMLAGLTHKAIVPVIEIFSHKRTETVYYTMPYIDSTPLSNYVRHYTDISKEQIYYLLCTIMDTLEYIHSKRIIHRDLKPGNILISPDGKLTIIDFGAARLISSTAKDQVLTMNFAPLEQYRGEEEGPWTDIYSLAATMATLITGSSIPTSIERMGKIDLLDPLTQRTTLVEKFGLPLLASLSKALQLEVRDRYKNISSWRSDLENQSEFQSIIPKPIIYVH